LKWPGKNIAFVFSDPAGTNACLALSRMFQKEFGIAPFLFSNKKYFVGAAENFQLTETCPDFAALEIDCVFTGTSHPSSSGHFEVNCIRKAKHQNIYVVSFIDHWVNFKLRFEGLEQEEFPDEIWVVDQKAKELAISEGLNESCIRIRPNPYHEYLRTEWKPAYHNKEYLDKLLIPKDGFHILFAPDPLSLREGKETVGFTESEAFTDLIEALNSAGSEVRVIVKCHPLQPEGMFDGDIKTKIKTFIVREADVLELINVSDLVVGFYSNVLLEAEAIGKMVLRYFPGKNEADLLFHKSSLKLARNREELAKELKHCIYG
jgi:hypothetical protein